MDAGHLDIMVSTGRVEITSTRNQNIARLFSGRQPNFVTSTIPLVFSVCGAAQTWAGKLCLAAAQQEENDELAQNGSVAVAAEALREHLMRIAVDWQRAIAGEPAAAEDLRRIYRLPKLALAGSDALQEEACLLLEKWVGPVNAILAGPDTISHLPTVGGRLLRRVAERQWQGLGDVANPAENERTAFRLVAGEPCMQDLAAEHGSGLLTRLHARLVHAALLVSGLERGEAAPCPSRNAEGWGEAQVETSRGTLTHRARVENGLVAAYEIVAPTDVNFTNGGPVEKALLKLATERQDDLASTARLMVEAFDPCVAYGLRVQ